MSTASTLIVYRGKELSLSDVHEAARQVLGGHLRPDAELVAHASAPVRVDRNARGTADPLAGTVRCLHLAVPTDCEGLLTDLSHLVLPGKLGFPSEDAAAGYEAFGHTPMDAVALALSRSSGPVATLTSVEDDVLMGAYSIFSTGRRLWSASYEPGVRYCTWDGNTLAVQELEHGDPSPPEGDLTEFPAHGLSLLFAEPLELTWSERTNLLATLWRACRPPTEGHESMVLAEGGRFVTPGRPLHDEDWNRLTRSFRA
ncbi:MAG: hypothetical protein KDA24_26635 [Deltaproteobacteria bacterium]|nr:hypothetical protein [Deltaproteobacteria bacterium]